LCIFLSVSDFITTNVLSLLLSGMQPSVFVLSGIVYGLMLDNITFTSDLVVLTLLRREAEKTSTKLMSQQKQQLVLRIQLPLGLKTNRRNQLLRPETNRRLDFL
jgi:hypothetical protein